MNPIKRKQVAEQLVEEQAALIDCLKAENAAVTAIIEATEKAKAALYSENWRLKRRAEHLEKRVAMMEEAQEFGFFARHWRRLVTR